MSICIPERGMMDGVSAETDAWLDQANARLAAARQEEAAAYEDFVAACQAKRGEGAPYEEIARRTILSNTQVFRLLNKAEAAAARASSADTDSASS
jgi:hypothetical protein